MHASRSLTLVHGDEGSRLAIRAGNRIRSRKPYGALLKARFASSCENEPPRNVNMHDAPAVFLSTSVACLPQLTSISLTFSFNA
jgi:hypothetical protein